MLHRSRYGYSLIEVGLVIGVIGTLVGIALPAVQAAREAAARVNCLNNLKQIGVAFHHFHDSYGRLPPLPVATGMRGDPNACIGWMALILPHMEPRNCIEVASKRVAKTRTRYTIRRMSAWPLWCLRTFAPATRGC